MRTMRYFAAAAILLALCFCNAEEKKPVKFETKLSTHKDDPPIVEGKFMVRPPSVTTETIPAVFRTLPDGTLQMVAPEKQIRHPVPAVYETILCTLVLDADMTKKFKVLAEKKATVEIAGEWAAADKGLKKGINVTSIKALDEF